MKFLLAFIALFAIVKADPVSVGTCQFVGTALNSGAAGSAYFVQPTAGGNVSVTLALTGVSRTDANHGFHVHAFGNVSDTAAAAAVGSHYIGGGSASHGCPSSDTRHEGDMGNVYVDPTGAVSFSSSFDIQTLDPSSANSIIGHGAIFHNATDDCVATTSSGSRLAQCVIGIANPEFTPANIAVNYTNTAGNQAQPSTNNRLFCFLQATNGNGVITGYVDFLGTANGVQVTAVINGLTNINTAYGLHIHIYGDLTGNTGNALGGHYNPTNQTHGIPPNTSRHIGDLGNVCGYTQNAGSANTFYYQYTNPELTMSGMQSIIGRGIALHNKTDVQGATMYGARVAHGVIGVANASLPAVAQLSTLFTNLQSADCSGPILLTPAATPAPTPSPSTTSPAPSTTSPSTTSPSTTSPATTAAGPTPAPTTSRTSTTTSSASAAAVASFAALVAAAVLLM